MTATLTDVAVVAEPSKRRKLPIIVAVVLLVVLGGGAAAWFLFLAPEGEEEPAELIEGQIVTLEPLTTTLGESGLRHARVAMGVVLVEGQDPLVVTEREALLKDALLREVALMDADQLRSAAGSDQLRTQLTADAQTIWGEGVVLRVVLTELLVQ